MVPRKGRNAIKSKVENTSEILHKEEVYLRTSQLLGLYKLYTTFWEYHGLLLSFLTWHWTLIAFDPAWWSRCRSPRRRLSVRHRELLESACFYALRRCVGLKPIVVSRSSLQQNSVLSSFFCVFLHTFSKTSSYMELMNWDFVGTKAPHSAAIYHRKQAIYIVHLGGIGFSASHINQVSERSVPHEAMLGQ